MKILFVYGHEPSGHASAAHALEFCARAQGLEAVCANISDYHSVLGPAIAKTYLQLIQKWPGLWTALYDNQLVAGVARNWQKLYIGLQGSKLESKLKEIRPDLVVCTHAPPLAALALEKAKGGFDWPLVAVITDFRVHSYWIAPRADLYLAATSEESEFLEGKGIPLARVRDTGIPIHPVFEQPLEKTAARKSLGLSGESPVILITGGSRGLGQLAVMAQTLLKKLKSSHILIVCGSNQELYEELNARACAGGRLLVFGRLPPDKIKQLMCASDLLIGKAGGLTSSEALAVGLPMIFFKPIPGQEIRNAEFLLERGAAVQARSLDELTGLVAGLLESKNIEAMSRKAKALGRPDSARRALEAMLAICQ